LQPRAPLEGPTPILKMSKALMAANRVTSLGASYLAMHRGNTEDKETATENRKDLAGVPFTLKQFPWPSSVSSVFPW